MALKEIKVGGNPVLVEVTVLDMEGREGFEYTSKDENEDMAERIEGLVSVLTAPVQTAFTGAGADEWSLEVNVGFKGETGLPFVAKGEANAAVKVTAKWKR